MKRTLLICLLLFIFTHSARLPAAAQDVTANPAAFLPSRATVYVELRTDEAGIAALDGLTDFLTTLAGTPQGNLIDDLVKPFVAQMLPGSDFRSDILPWLGDRMAVSASSAPGASPAPEDFVFVLPMRDAASAQAFVESVGAGAAPQDAGGVQVYTIGDAKLAVGTSVIWLGAGTTIDSLFSFALENLSQNPAYQQVRAALPADAAMTAYVSGGLVATTAAPDLDILSSEPSMETLWQALLRLHPAQSATEDAMLALPPLNGVGFAIQSTGTQADLTAVLSVNAEYPAPTLTTASAGTALLDVIPADSVLAFSSYDVSLPLIVGGAFSWLTSPVNGGTFTTITDGLQATEAPPTPTSSPMLEPMTADTLLAQIEPIIRQAESTMGLARGELYGLINGEYAFAVFPNEPNVGLALYVQSADAQRLIDTLDHVSHLVLTNPDPVEQLFTLEQTTIGSTEVTFVSSPNLSERFALGIVNGNVLFITPESSAQRVIDAASDATPSPAAPLRDQFGAGQEAFFFLDLPALQATVAEAFGSEIASVPLSSLSGAQDVRENGLFVLRLSGVLGE